MSPCRSTRCRCEEAHRYGVAHDRRRQPGHRVRREAATARSPACISMGIYVFNRQVLIDQLVADVDSATRRTTSGATSSRRWSRTRRARLRLPLRRLLARRRHIESYFDGNMDLLEDLPALNLYDPEHAHPHAHHGSTRRRRSDAAPTSRARCSTLGCIINGHVEHSVLSPGVYRRGRRRRARLDHLRQLPHRARRHHRALDPR